MKKRKIKGFIFASFLFFSSNLLAQIKPMGSLEPEKYNSSQNAKPCVLRGYSKISCPEGQKPANFCPEDAKFFSSCGCDKTFFKFSNKNCDLKMMELSGESCLSGNVRLYTSCKCKSDFKICRKGSAPRADSCTDEDGKKYDMCREDVSSCESLGQLSRQPKGYRCQGIRMQYRFCYISETCEKIERPAIKIENPSLKIEGNL